MNKASLAQRLKEIYDPRPDKIIFVKGDPTVKYQDVIFAMDMARGGREGHRRSAQGQDGPGGE